MLKNSPTECNKPIDVEVRQSIAGAKALNSFFLVNRIDCHWGEQAEYLDNPAAFKYKYVLFRSPAASYSYP